VFLSTHCVGCTCQCAAHVCLTAGRCSTHPQLQGKAVLQRLAAPTLFSFTAIMFREVLMDVADVEGGGVGSSGHQVSTLVSTRSCLAYYRPCTWKYQ
jgi:hypothetical protein